MAGFHKRPYLVFEKNIPCFWVTSRLGIASCLCACRWVAWLLLFRSMSWSPRWWQRASRMVGPMENSDLKSMAIDDLWELHEQVTAKLTRELAIEKARLEERLHKLGSASNIITSDRQRRPYPKVLPKYRNPKNPAETWSGRGKQPRWLTAQLRSGKKAKDFLIRAHA